MERRRFLRLGAAAAVAVARPAEMWGELASEPTPVFTTGNQRWQRAYDAALKVLAGNVRTLPRFDRPVLIEGADYAGIWMECGPHEGLVYRKFRPDTARNGHLTFFALQREDGQLPANNKMTETGFGQIQMVVPIAATAWELARDTHDDELLQAAYKACSRWDDWLIKFRNTRGTGLTEGFCTYDTGHDNSPRWAGIPPQCPKKDAKLFPPLPTLPWLCPDLSATTYGARVALASMAKALGKNAEADHWTEKAEAMRRLILEKLYVPEDAAFYDLDAQGKFIRVRSDVLSRMCSEHVVDQKTFDALWERQIHNPKAFWPKFPMPSIAMDDPTFVRPIPRNSWGGAAQALTALRAGRWFDHYGRSAEHSHMMEMWCEAIQADMTFRQQIDPLTGAFTQEDLPSYSPCALVMMDHTWRLAGVREEVETLVWSVRPGHAVSQDARFEMPVGGGRAVMKYEGDGASLTLGGRLVASVKGGVVRIVTDRQGRLQEAVGVASTVQEVSISDGRKHQRKLTIKPNERVKLG